MRLIVKEFIAKLRERNELDVLLPELLSEMGILPKSEPQRGTRQYGVDIAAAGTDPIDHQKKLFLFVVKPGNIGRTEWSASTPQSVKPSLEQVLETYLNISIPSEHKHLPKVVVLAINGLMKEEIKVDWSQFTLNHQQKAEIRLWDLNVITDYVLDNLLDETLFTEMDRSALRKALALAGEIEYDRRDLESLLFEKLGFSSDGNTVIQQTEKRAERAGIQANLISQMYSRWAEGTDNLKQSVLGAERNLLWMLHRVVVEQKNTYRCHFLKQADYARQHYLEQAAKYLVKITPFCSVRDGLSVGAIDDSIFSLTLFEQIGFIASVGLIQSFSNSKDIVQQSGKTIDLLQDLVMNHAACSSPRLDEHMIDVNLGFLLLLRGGRLAVVEEWLSTMVVRVAQAFAWKRFFPYGTVEELISDFPDLDTTPEQYQYHSWALPTMADWCILFRKQEAYKFLAEGHARMFNWVCPGLWHPVSEDYRSIFYKRLTYSTGANEVPIELDMLPEKYKTRMKMAFSDARFKPSINEDFSISDYLLACRHFRTNVPPALIYNETNAILGLDLAACVTTN